MSKFVLQKMIAKKGCTYRYLKFNPSVCCFGCFVWHQKTKTNKKQDNKEAFKDSKDEVQFEADNHVDLSSTYTLAAVT